MNNLTTNGINLTDGLPVLDTVTTVASVNDGGDAVSAVCRNERLRDNQLR